MGASAGGPTDLVTKQKMLKSLINFVFADLVVPLAAYHFYVTEAQGYKARIWFFRKPLWSRLVSAHMDSLVDSGQYKLYPKGLPINERKSHAVPKVRFVPKKQGLRPIVNHSKSEAKMSANQTMVNLFAVLSYEKTRQQGCMGASVLSVNDVCRRLARFKASLTALTGGTGGGAKHNNLPPLYFVSVDLSKCFDMINQESLIKVVSPLLSEDDYRIVRFWTVQCDAQSQDVHSKYQRHVLPPTQYPQASDLARTVLRKKFETLFLDSVYQARVDRRALQERFQKFVHNSYVKHGRNVYLQRRGISQGSLVSSLLCSLYYGYIDGKILPKSLLSSARVYDDARPTVLSDPANGTGCTMASSAEAISQASSNSCRSSSSSDGLHPVRHGPRRQQQQHDARDEAATTAGQSLYNNASGSGGDGSSASDNKSGGVEMTETDGKRWAEAVERRWAAQTGMKESPTATSRKGRRSESSLSPSTTQTSTQSLSSASSLPSAVTSPHDLAKTSPSTFSSTSPLPRSQAPSSLSSPSSSSLVSTPLHPSMGQGQGVDSRTSISTMSRGSRSFGNDSISSSTSSGQQPQGRHGEGGVRKRKRSSRLNTSGETPPAAPQQQRRSTSSPGTSPPSTSSGSPSPPSSVLFRMIDDFLLITTSKAQATEFLQTMLSAHKVVPSIVTNPGKTRTNFPTGVVGVNDDITCVDDVFFPWCGLRFDTCSLEVLGGFGSMNEGHVGDSLSTPTGRAPGREVIRRLVRFVRQKCHIVYLSPDIQSSLSAARNMFECLCVAAMRLHVYFRSKPTPAALHGRPDTAEFAFLRRAMEGCIHCGVTRAVDRAPIGHYPTRLAGLLAFAAVLGKKPTRYKHILTYTRSQAERCRKRAGGGAGREGSAVARLIEKIDQNAPKWFSESFADVKY